MDARDRLIVAADLSTRDEILALVDELHGSVGCFKLGLQAFVSNGPELVREVVSRGERVFLDLKFHDIPNTASHAVAEASRLGVAMTTIHVAGGEAMLTACRDAAAAAPAPPLVLGVTVLTSLDAPALESIGVAATPLDQAVALAKLAQRSGLGGIVSSPLEIAAIREACGSGLAIVTPGIRGAGDAAGDQRRTMSAAEAIRAGADYLVVGRPITSARDRRAAALRFVDEIAAA